MLAQNDGTVKIKIHSDRTVKRQPDVSQIEQSVLFGVRRRSNELLLEELKAYIETESGPLAHPKAASKIVCASP